jgi:hypothetical protein
MKRDRKDLENVLYQAIEASKENMRKNNDLLIDKLNNYGINAGKTIGIYNKTIPLVTLSNAEIYIFTKSLFEITDYTSIDISKWFTDEEIKTYNQYKAPKSYKNNVIILNNVDQTADNRYFCTKATYKEMSDIFGQGLITYNLRTQREAKVITFGDKFISIPDIREKPVLEMTDLMLKGKFTPNTITLNIRKPSGKYDYDPKTRTLMIECDHKESFCDIIDGGHRGQAFIRVIEQDPNNQGYTYISILNYTEEEAQEYIEQEDHRTPINKTHIAAFKNADEYVTLTKDINKYGSERNNELFNRIALNDVELKTQDKYVTVATFSDALKLNFGKFENAREISNVQDYLIKFFNELIGIIKEKYFDNNVVFKPNMFIGYIALASVLIKDENWKMSLERILNRFDFNDDSIWQNIGIFSNKVNLSLIRNISEYFKKVGDGNV